MDQHQRHSSSLCKRRRNKIPLNLASTKKGNKKRRLKITKEIVDVPLSSHNVVTTDSPWPNNDESESYQENVIDDTIITSVSAHTKRKQKLSERWNALRSDAYKVMIQAHALFPNQSCFTCNSDNANVRCEQCGPALYMCSNCCISIHSKSHHHHFPEIWQDNSFIPFKLPTSTVWISDHECASKFFRLITCFHIEGIPYQLNIQFCKCVPDALRLIKLGYWPATPTRPVLAFTHSFMEWMEALLLECQVSVQDFSSAVEMIIKEKFMKMPCSIYPVLIDTFEEFRNLKEELRHLKGIVEKDLFKCPACRKEQGKLTLSIDANFGLCRKKAAGNSVHEPLSGTMMFFDQDDVDHFIADYGSSLGTSSDCSKFLAGHALRSRSRFAALSETAIMGVVCRHEFPLCFINLFHGERISYCMYILEQLKAMFPNQEVEVMYDVACVLTKHLKAKKRDDLLTKFSFAVPVFHAYGHKAECQISMNPRNMEGYGLSDGEIVERLWSYLRRFSTMTKEMRPAHRIDVLTHGLSYYGRCAAEHIGLLLCKRMDNAVNTLSEAKKNLQILLKESPEPVTETNIVAWASEAKIQLSNESTITTKDPPPTWQEMYVTHLDTLQTFRNALQQPVGDNASVQTLTCNLIKTEMLLQKTEESHELVRRWTPNCQEYVATKDIMKSNLRKKLKSKIRCYARERWFLLRLKSKYAGIGTLLCVDGQKIAIRLSRRIAVVSKLLKKSLALYNSGIDASCHLLWSEAIGLSSQIYKDCLFDESSVPTVVKYQAVKLHHRISRSEEEIARIKTEMCNCVNHYIDVHEYLLKHAEVYEQSEHPLHLYDLGKLCLLKKAMKKCMYQLQSLQCLLRHTELEQLQGVLTSLSGQLEHEVQYVPDQDDIEQGIHSNENMSADHDTDLDQNFAASNQGVSINKFSVVNPMSDSTNSSTSTKGSPATILLQDYNSVSDVGVDSATNISRDSGSSVATLLNNDTNDVIVQSPKAAGDVQSAANNILNHEDNLHSDTNTEQDLFTVGPSSLFLHSEETYDITKRFSTAASNQVTDTESHEPVTESSSEESDEEMVVQDWRINRFLRETYLDSIRNVDDDLSKLLTDLEQSAKVKIMEREKESTIKPVSYLNIPREVLEKSIKQFELTEKRAEKRERLQKLPVFQIK